MVERSELRPLDYETTLTIEEARQRYIEVETAFQQVEKKYSGILSRLRSTIAGDDMTILSNCIGVLLPLSMKPSVQEEIRQKVEIEDTLWTKAGQLQARILLFASTFKNSGVKRIEGGEIDF